ncbi:MAG: TlpA disulfide reductase family protein [Pseudomonadota bacterium]
MSAPLTRVRPFRVVLARQAMLAIGALVISGLVTSCTEEGTASAPPEEGDAAQASTAPAIPALPPALGPWRATVQLPGGELPFTLRLAESATGLTATVENGEERVPVGRVVQEAGELLFEFPAFNNRIDAALRDDGSLVGDLTLIKRGGETQVMPFEAYPGAVHRFRVTNPSRVDLHGRWAVTFTDDEGKLSPAVGEFSQAGGELTGTFLTPTGDYRYLAGNVDGDTMALSTFDGAHAFLFRARMQEDGTLVGDFWSGTRWHERWRARRDEKAALPDPQTLTFLKAGYDSFAFEFPDQDGQPVSLDDPRFADKVVLVTLAGSWCPNCHDEAGYLAEYYRRNRELGVEVVCLMYEHFEDFDTAAAQVKRFREKFDIEYTTLVAGISDKTKAAQTLPMLNRVLAFPTTIFVDRAGEVRRIHTGFSGPGTGQHFVDWEREFLAFMSTLLSEAGSTASR